MASAPGDRATVSDLLDAATKLDGLANDIEKTGHKVGGAAAAAAALNRGFALGAESVATCGHLHTCIADTVRDMRAQADHLRQTAATYTELESHSQTQVTIA